MIDKRLTDDEIIKGWCRRELCPTAQEIINYQKAEIERLNNVISNVQLEVSDRIEKQIKAEAYKEFADRLKKQTINNNVISVKWLHSYIDNLVKETLGND